MRMARIVECSTAPVPAEFVGRRALLDEQIHRGSGHAPAAVRDRKPALRPAVDPLHALKVTGHVKILENSKFHATFTWSGSRLAARRYASGTFHEPWFELAFRDAKNFPRRKNEILQRAFQVNHERFLTRWPRFQELYE